MPESETESVQMTISCFCLFACVYEGLTFVVNGRLEGGKNAKT